MVVMFSVIKIEKRSTATVTCCMLPGVHVAFGAALGQLKWFCLWNRKPELGRLAADNFPGLCMVVAGRVGTQGSSSPLRVTVCVLSGSGRIKTKIAA